MNIDQLYGQIYADEFCKNPDDFIKLIESNIVLINNITIGEDRDLHDKLLNLTADYAHFLTIRENYRKALPQINKAISLFESHPDYANTDLFSLFKYEYLIFCRAVANYYLKNIRTAIKDLKMLHSEFPDNDKYDNWLKASLKFQARQILRVVWYIYGGALLMFIFFKILRIDVLNNILPGIIFIGILVVIPLELVLIDKKKKAK